MAKKNIISDFSALKGKVTFSEKIPDIKVSTKVTPAAAPKPKESDMGLKTGQSVVLMDSDLRGKIIGSLSALISKNRKCLFYTAQELKDYGKCIKTTSPPDEWRACSWSLQGMILRPPDYESGATNQLS